MVSPMVKATIQACTLAGISNLIAQLISCYRAQVPFTVDLIDLSRYVIFSIIMTPPNYTWQAWLEGQFPGYASQLSQLEKEKVMDDAVKGKATGVEDSNLYNRAAGKTLTGKDSTEQSNHGRPKRRLNLTNTAIKFALDQTFGAAINNLLFIIGIALLRGESFATAQDNVREKFWPVIFAGQKLWPAVSILSFTVVPLERRTLFGSTVGLFWGVYLSLVSQRKQVTSSA